MIDLYLITAESVLKFRTLKQSLKSICLNQQHQPQAVLALSTKVLENYQILEQEIIKYICSVDQLQKQLLIVLLFEYLQNGFPNKRRKMSQQTRNSISLIKQKIDLELVKSQVPQLSIFQLQETSKYFRISKIEQKPTVIELLNAENILHTPTIFDDVIELKFRKIPHNYLKQYGEFQSLASCLPVKCLQQVLKKGSVLDLCAAPGSKSLQAACFYQKVHANELDPKRFRILQQRCANLENMSLTNQDAFLLVDQLLESKQQFDAIVLDPTCSSSGRVNSDKVLQKLAGQQQKSTDIEQLADFQKKLLFKALEIGKKLNVKYLTYSTCSVHQEENEDVVSNVMALLKLQNINVQLLNALPEWPDRSQTMQQCLKSGELHSGEGFFVALFSLQ